MIALVGFGAIGGLLARLARVPDLFWAEFTARVQGAVPALRSAVPVATGNLRGSFSVRVRGGMVQVGSSDPAAPYIRYRAPGGYGARTVGGTIDAWARRTLPGIVRQSLRAATRGI